MQVADQRVVAGASAVLSWQLIGPDGEPADPGTVLVTVIRADGSAVVTGQATSGAGTAARTFTLTPAQTRQIDRLAVDWTVGGLSYRSQVVDVAGGIYFGNGEVRGRPGMSAAGAAAISNARAVIETRFESWTRQAWVPRVAVETVPATSSDLLLVEFPTVRRVRAVDFLAGATLAVTSSLSPSQCAAIPASDIGALCRAGGWSAGQFVRVVYEHGAGRPPEDLRSLAIDVCREMLTVDAGGGLPENAVTYSQSQTGMTISLVVPGVRGAVSKIPDVNEAIARYTFDVPGFG